METICILLFMIILLLLRLNYNAIKRIKESKHDALNLSQLKKVNSELIDKIYEYKRIQALQNYRLNLAQKTNFVLMEKYNLLEKGTIDIPYKHHRYFMLYPNNLPIYEFTEN